MGTTEPAGRWQVYVFENSKVGQMFARYQRARHSAPLAPRDYVALRKLWPRTLAVYNFEFGRERIFYPSRGPQNWWQKRVLKSC